MDTVFIENLTTDAVIGCLPWERKIRQRLVFTIEMSKDCSKPAQNDTLEDTLDYAAISARIISFVHASRFKLIETLAEHVAALILREFPCQHLKLRLKKPGAVPQAESVGVQIERRKELS